MALSGPSKPDARPAPLPPPPPGASLGQHRAARATGGVVSKVGWGETSFLALGREALRFAGAPSQLRGKAQTPGHHIGGSLPPSVFLGPPSPWYGSSRTRCLENTSH